MDSQYSSTMAPTGSLEGAHSVSLDDSLSDAFFIKADPYSNHLTELSDARHMEKTLQKLLTDFHAEKLQAFGETVSCESMLKIREQQENLARLHFELNLQRSSRQRSGSFSSEEFFSENSNAKFENAFRKPFSKTSVLKLIQNLQSLCKSIDRLQTKNATTRFPNK